MDNDLPIDRRTLLEVTSLVALSGTARGGAAGSVGTDRNEETDTGLAFGYGGAPVTATARARSDVPSASGTTLPPSEHDDQGYGEHGYGGVVP